MVDQDFLINNILELSNSGIWGFNLELDNSFNYVYSTRFIVNDNDNDDLEIFYLYDPTDPNVGGNYECTIVNNQLSLTKNGRTVLTEDHCDGVFLLKVQGIKLALVIPEIPQNGQFHFDIHSDTPSQPVIHMVHGILLENSVQYYGSYSFSYELDTNNLQVTFPDNTSETFYNVQRNPEVWYQHGNYKFAFLMRFDGIEPGSSVGFGFDYTGESSQYFDGVQISSMDGSSTLYGYYNPADPALQMSFSITYDTTYFYFNGTPYSSTEFFITSNPSILFWTKKVEPYNSSNFNFNINQ